MNQEIERRRTFAIISHPDAGKTTLTEKLLLFGGQIQVAGAVKNNKIKKTATSDWMEIEKQRGISVTTSVMEFDYDGYKINILDTPGHQDFAEDTFRTLTAVDSAIIVVDGAKGVEAQTRKLMTVCRMRKTPVIVFINKLDREGRDPFDLLDELEQELQISVRPLSWPINQGARFKGVYNIYEQNLNLFTPDKQKVTEHVSVDIDSDELEARVGEQDAAKLREDLELVDGVYPAFNVEDYLDAKVAPVFFGSALNNFGVQELLDCFVKIAPYPRPTQAEEREVRPEEEKFTGFIFKITANIDPNHRSCIAFCKVCSGRFRRNAPYLHVRQGKMLAFRFSRHFGLTDNDDLSGAPYYAVVEDEHIIDELETTGDEKKKKDDLMIGVSLPGKIKVNIVNDGRTVAQYSTYAAQYGRVELLSGALFGKKITSHIVLNPVTGNVISLKTEPLE